MKKKPSRFPRGCGWLMGVWVLAVLAVLVVLAGMAAVNRWPSLGAQGVDFLRSVIGDEAVARLEKGAYQVQDTIQKAIYDLGWLKPVPPEQQPRTQAAIQTPLAPSPSPGQAIPTPSLTPLRLGAPTSTPFFPETATPTAVTWQPEALIPLDSLSGEGAWSPYIQDAAGRPVAYLTSFQPDPQRPYAVVAVVAFDLDYTRLHFVLGSVEPYVPNTLKNPLRTGLIPDADRAPGVLLAMFNGGFKGRHGQFGAMAGGVVALPARDGLGTLVIDREGGVRIGEWGTEITQSEDMLAWRQNGPLVIQQGGINLRVYDNSPSDWGYTLSGDAPTWRSGVGLSADRRTFFYFCGSSLTMGSLADSMLAAGAANAIQLDINPYWVHFVAVHTDGKKLILEPLFPRMMKGNIDRYLWPYPRDYFYVTGIP